MKFSIIALATMLAQAVAQDVYDVRSDGFRLILKSTDPTLDNHAVGTCHQGAAHKGLCLTDETITDPPRHYTTFYHNVSSFFDEPANANDTGGILNWDLRFNNGAGITPCAMAFEFLPGSNVADMIFAPGRPRIAHPVYFQEGNGIMYIRVVQNDTGKTPVPFEPPLKLTNWYVCTTRYSYTYRSLVWNVGLWGWPQNPTCSEVDVYRVWV